MSEEIQEIRQELFLNIIKNEVFNGKIKVLDVGCQDGKMCNLFAKEVIREYNY